MLIGRFSVLATFVVSLVCRSAATPPSQTASPKAPASPEKPSEPKAKSPFKSFAVYALSRGKGVPQEAREALGKVREVIEGDRGRGVGVKVQTKRIGIEGETRVCAEYEDPKDAARAFERAKAFVKGVDLVNLVVEPCDKPAAPDKAQKEEARP